MQRITEQVTLVVAAAGLGKRMGHPELPKSLVKFKGFSLIDWAISSFVSQVTNIAIVVRPEHLIFFKNHFLNQPQLKISYIFQEEARGTAFAVRRALEFIETKYALVVWGDHIGASFLDVNPIYDSANAEGFDFFLPLVFRSKPYVYFTRNPLNNCLEFHETTKGAASVEYGLSDCGVFLFNSAKMREFLNFHLSTRIIDLETDLNFLSLLGAMQTFGITFREILLNDIRLTLGINSISDLERLESWLGEEGWWHGEI